MAKDVSPGKKREILKGLLQPLIGLCLRRAFTYQEFLAVAKEAFIDSAVRELTSMGKKVNSSRISAITGIRRADIREYLDSPSKEYEDAISVPQRVVGQWLSDSRFLTGAGKPRSLTFQGPRSEFSRLVETVTKHIHPRSILDELERVGSIQKRAKTIQLSYDVFSMQEDESEALALLAKDIDTLVSAVDQNIAKEYFYPNLHIRTEYDNIFEKDLPKIRKWFVAEGKKLHKRARAYLSKYDQDITLTRDDEPAAARVSLTAVSFTTSPTAPEKSRNGS